MKPCCKKTRQEIEAKIRGEIEELEELGVFKCNKCNTVEICEISGDTTWDGKPMTRHGWMCREESCEGKLILEQEVIPKKALNDLLDTLKLLPKTLTKRKEKKR